jgi:uncharacterized protein (TIGR03083 family)
VSEGFVALTNDQRAELLGLLSSLPAEDWTQSTGCRGWPVHDVVAHLVEGELLFGRVYRGELKALTREDADPQAGVERWARADGETLRFSLWHHGSATQRVIDSRSEDSWNRDLSVFDRTLLLRDVLRLHFFDLALHSYDVGAALGAPSLWGDRVPSIVEYCVRGAPHALTSAALKSDAGVRVEVAGVGSWTLGHRDGAWDIEGPDAPGAATWKTDPETLVLVTTGRLPVSEALDRSSVDGDAVLLGDVLAAWQVKSA